jgi:CheY-like chemotaxis protein
MWKILIVDDQPAVRELVRVTLEVGNYQIFSAENGQQALDIAQAEHPDIILLDIKMPGSTVSGLEVCRYLKEDPATADIYIIIISASGQKDDIAAGVTAGADDYFTKPFSPIALINKIESVVEALK